MRVKDLIALLQGMDPELPVILARNDEALLYLDDLQNDDLKVMPPVRDDEQRGGWIISVESRSVSLGVDHLEIG